MEINKKILIEDLIDNYPNSISYLMDKNIKCVRCGEPVWGTLEDAAKEKGYTDEEIIQIVEELNRNFK